MRLVGSRREAEGILALVPPGQGRHALDFAASRATATSGDLAGYRLLHFATHGLLDNVHPELSGLVLSLVDEKGHAQDGFLRLHDVYNLKLPADLVVLSACQTGLGKEVRGEGLVGLTRGFMYAGATRVMTTLWKVDDRATAELMKRFYEGMLGPRRLSPAAALRAAQVALSPLGWAKCEKGSLVNPADGAASNHDVFESRPVDAAVFGVLQPTVGGWIGVQANGHHPDGIAFPDRVAVAGMREVRENGSCATCASRGVPGNPNTIAATAPARAVRRCSRPRTCGESTFPPLWKKSSRSTFTLPWSS